MVKTVVHLGNVLKKNFRLIYLKYLLYKKSNYNVKPCVLCTYIHRFPAYKSISIQKILPLYKMVCLSDTSLIVVRNVSYPILT
jgi:ABC-type polysaccharide transport system permease subunit